MLTRHPQSTHSFSIQPLLASIHREQKDLRAFEQTHHIDLIGSVMTQVAGGKPVMPRREHDPAMADVIFPETAFSHSAVNFEAAHPKITRTSREVLDALQKIGL